MTGTYTLMPCPYCGHGSQAFAVAVAHASAEIRTNERQRCIAIVRLAKRRADTKTQGILNRIETALRDGDTRDA